MSALDFAFLFLIGAFLPYAVIKAARRQGIESQALPPKTKAFWATILNLSVIGALALATAWLRGSVLFPRWRPSSGELTTGFVLLLTLIALRLILGPWLRKGQNRTALYLRPRDWKELPLWAFLSCCAGFFEEIAYRGVLFFILVDLTRSVVTSVVLACLAFGLAHMRQGFRAVIFITLLCATFHWLVIRYGNLYLAMIVHALYDVAAGVQNIWRTRAERTASVVEH